MKSPYWQEANRISLKHKTNNNSPFNVTQSLKDLSSKPKPQARSLAQLLDYMRQAKSKTGARRHREIRFDNLVYLPEVKLQMDKQI